MSLQRGSPSCGRVWVDSGQGSGEPMWTWADGLRLREPAEGGGGGRALGRSPDPTPRPMRSRHLPWDHR